MDICSAQPAVTRPPWGAGRLGREFKKGGAAASSYDPEQPARGTENFRPGVLAEMGFTEARLKEINPRLIVASINGYGSTGPYADRPSFDFIAQDDLGLHGDNG
jgi:CoA-transferase family III